MFSIALGLFAKAKYNITLKIILCKTGVDLIFDVQNQK